jgi:DNA replication and repair protein RecF
MAGVRSDYDRVLKQRNSLLKSAVMARRHGGRDVDTSTLDVWDEHLARVGAELLARRLELISALRPLADKAYERLAPGGGPVGLEYKGVPVSAEGGGARGGPEGENGGGAGRPAGQPAEPSVDSDDVAPAAEPPPVLPRELYEGLLGALREARRAEMERGVTLVGPHRDDLLLKLGELPAKGYASHGESWSLALSLRLASYELLKSEGNEPVLVLDDVFAELDAQRRARLAELVAPGEQVLVTAAVPEDVPEVLEGARFAVADGEVVRR